MDWYGRKLSPEDWKHTFFSASLRQLDVVRNLNGTGFVALGQSTSRMTKAEMSDLQTLMEAFGAEKGVRFSAVEHFHDRNPKVRLRPVQGFADRLPRNPTQACGMADGTVCAAHSNEARHGKGRSIKASDVYVASLCHKCHSDLDQGNQMSRAERAGMWDTAHRNTVKTLVAVV